MANPRKNFSSLPTDTMKLMQICGLTAPLWIKWKYREDIVDVLKKYNRARGKMTKEAVVQKLMNIPAGEYHRALDRLVDYVESN